MKQGLEPSRLSLELASGCVIGVLFPVLGIATVACTGVADLYRLNLPAIQLANYLVFPLQIIFFPFLYIEKFTTGNYLNERSKAKLLEIYDLGFLTAIQELTQYFILASPNWALALAPLLAIFYFF